jgi:hypothetical protein
MNEVNSDGNCVLSLLKYLANLFSTSCGIFTKKTPQKCFEKCVGQKRWRWSFFLGGCYLR